MRATCDTNVLVRAAVRPAGPARAVFIELLSDEHLLIVSEHIIAEVARVLRYERVRKQAELTEEEIDAFVADLRELGETVNVPTEPPAIVSDPDDNMVVATAIGGRAEVICSRDRHIRHPLVQAYCATFGIRVLTDVELLHSCEAARLTSDGVCGQWRLPLYRWASLGVGHLQRGHDFGVVPNDLRECSQYNSSCGLATSRLAIELTVDRKWRAFVWTLAARLLYSEDHP